MCINHIRSPAVHHPAVHPQQFHRYILPAQQPPQPLPTLHCITPIPTNLHNPFSYLTPPQHYSHPPTHTPHLSSLSLTLTLLLSPFPYTNTQKG